MKIVVGVDESPHARAALKWIRGMTWPAGTRVIVVSAVRPMVMAYAEVYAPATASLQQADEDQLHFQQELTARAEQELRAGGLRTEARVLHGDPREVLVDTARAEGAQLLVVGSHGRSGLAKLLLGSVASHVVTHAPCNVMVVKI